MIKLLINLFLSIVFVTDSLLNEIYVELTKLKLDVEAYSVKFLNISTLSDIKFFFWILLRNFWTLINFLRAL